MINSNLIWKNNHIEELVTEKAFRKHYFLVQLKRAQVPCDDLVAYYFVCIYACPVLHSALPKSPALIIEGVQKRTLLCIFPGISYNETLVFSIMDCLRVYQEQITNQLFQSVVNNPSNKILSEGLLEKRVAGQLTIQGDTGFSTHTKLKQADTFINKSSSMVIYF